MKLNLLEPRDLGAEEIRQWQNIANQEPCYRSAFFSPHFTLAVSSLRPNTFVAVCEDNSGIQAFFPFHRKTLGIGKPIGGPLSDYHGVVARPGFDYDAADLIRRCGLKLFHFNHLISCQEPFFPYVDQRHRSPYLDLTAGYEAYLGNRRKAGTSQISSALRRLRKLEREFGPVRFVPQDRNEKAFSSLLRWKIEQYKSSGVPSVLDWSWPVELLQRLLSEEHSDFGGRLSTLYLEERPIAAHMGMVSHKSWHWWFPAYDREFARYSPGLILLLKMAAFAAETGISEIDLGRGPEPYKRAFASNDHYVLQGSVALTGVVPSLQRFYRGSENFCARLPVGRGIKKAGRVLNWLKHYNDFR